ncbi:MAG: hypothetical protein C3F11_17610 [Methylocystaceae bacterium]|nr:MAG: hypothetical protein C3F11_17610 [Methylocystaceae bacterium]
MLKQFGHEIWIADGPIVAVAGFRYPTRMAVIRLSDGGLFVWSPIALSDDLRAEVDALGDVRHLVAPNSLHHLFLDDWRRAYTSAKSYAPPGLRQKRKDIDFDGDLADAPIAAWADDIDQVSMPGNLITTEVVFFHRKSRVVLFTDLIQHFPADWFSGWRAIVARLDLMAAPEPSVPRKFRNATIDRRVARASLEHILAWPAEKVLMAHGEPIDEDGRAFIGRAFRWLTG